MLQTNQKPFGAGFSRLREEKAMQIQVINGSRADDSSDAIGFVIAGLKQTPDGLSIVHAKNDKPS